MQFELLRKHPVESLVTVELIQNERMTQTGKVLADLVVTTRVDLRFDKGGIGKLLPERKAGVSGNIPFSARRERRVDRPFPPGTSLHQREIDLPPTGKLGRSHRFKRLLAAREHHHARCFKVQTVQGFESRMVFPEKIQKRESIRCSCSGHHQLPRQLVHGKKMIIAVEDAIGGNHGYSLSLIRVIIGGIRSNRNESITIRDIIHSATVRNIPQQSKALTSIMHIFGDNTGMLTYGKERIRRLLQCALIAGTNGINLIQKLLFKTLRHE